MFESVLVANRGEIAVRICKTLRKMGIRSVVVASIPDRRSLAVRTADEWELLEGYSAAESYLDIDAVIAAAKKHGCQAIHPGYGFLSERADFAERCAAEGVVFVGPPPAVLRGMGDKAAARRLAVENGVPVVPGWDGADDDDTLLHQATKVGFPIMVKARGGGGGRGMREVRESEELLEAIQSARREAQAAFGDPGLLLEKLVTGAHHVEVQVLADSHGNFVHLGERDCSVQRRHQKLIEETPSPVVDEALRAELTGAALRLARAIGYANAGTFEFLVAEPGSDGKRPFYFLEVNPRLQVEHPVTEMVTGLDLVELQLRVAAGEPLPFRQEDVRFEGHAIEFRINAEDPWDGFKPSSGRIRWIDWGRARADFGYSRNDIVPAQYDSLLGKLIVHGRNRAEAVGDAREALRWTNVAGIATNVSFQRSAVASTAFVDGHATTDWLEGAVEGVLETATVPLDAWMAAAAGLWLAKDSNQSFAGPSFLGAGERTVWLQEGSTIRACAFSPTADGRSGHVACGGRIARFSEAAASDGLMAIRLDGRSEPVRTNTLGLAFGDVLVALNGWRDVRSNWVFEVVPPPPLPRRAAVGTAGASAVVAPLAGTIASVRVAEGDTVESGQLLLTLEAMKMEHRVLANASGVVKAVRVAVGDVVREGDVLVEVGD